MSKSAVSASRRSRPPASITNQRYPSAGSVALTVPDGWQSRSGMPSGDCGHCFTAADYDVLTDSPIETGIHRFYQTRVDGKPIELVIWGNGNYDGEAMLKDFAAISKTTNAMFGSTPSNGCLRVSFLPCEAPDSMT